MRDVVCNEVPLVLKQGELYVTCAFAGAGAAVALIALGQSLPIALIGVCSRHPCVAHWFYGLRLAPTCLQKSPAPCLGKAIRRGPTLYHHSGLRGLLAGTLQHQNRHRGVTAAYMQCARSSVNFARRIIQPRSRRA